MDHNEAYIKFKNIYEEFRSVKSPKYRNIDSKRLKIILAELLELKDFLNDNALYVRLLNAMSQVRQRQSWCKSTWNNISERGINKAIPPLIKKGGKDIEFPFKWPDEKTGNCCFITDYWDMNNYMVVDVIAYFYMLKEGKDILPKKILPVFEDITTIKNRECELQNRIPPQTDTRKLEESAIRDFLAGFRYKCSFTDRDFRQFTGKALGSNAILDLLLKTSRVEFKIAYPLRFSNSQNKLQEHPYTMNIFSRLFELAYVEDKIRSDGFVTNRRYYVIYNTILGEMFVHNLRMKNYDFIDNSFYQLPDTAQLLYRKFLMHNSYTNTYLNLSTIKEKLNLSDTNTTNLQRTIEESALESLKRYGYIKSFEVIDNGLNGKKYVIKKERKKCGSSDDDDNQQQVTVGL